MYIERTVYQRGGGRVPRSRLANGMWLDRPTIPRLLYHGSIERTRERDRERQRENESQIEDWPNCLWILMGPIGVLEYSFAISDHLPSQVCNPARAPFF